MIYLSVIVFSYRVYPYIPVAKGGGDYSRGERIAILHFDPHAATNSIPPFVIEPPPLKEFVGVDDALARTELQSKHIIVIAETSDRLYFVVPKFPDDQEKLADELARWRLPGQDNKPKHIFCVKRELISFITYVAQDERN